MDLNNLLAPRQGREQAPAQTQQQYTKEEYAAIKKAEREELWGRVDHDVETVFSDADSLRVFFGFVAKCSPQRTANLLLLYEQNPDITQPRTFERWKALGRNVRSEEQGYTALIGQNYEREDGRKGHGYNIGKVFDISQTNGRIPAAPETYQPEELVAALIEKSPVNIQVSDQLPDKVSAQYLPSQRTIYVRNNMDAATAFCSIAREQAHAGFDTDRSYRRQDFVAQSFCASIILAQKYGLNVAKVNLQPVLNNCAGMDAEGKRFFLSDVKSAVYSVSKTMEQSLNARQSEIVADDFAIPAAQAPRKQKAKPIERG